MVRQRKYVQTLQNLKFLVKFRLAKNVTTCKTDSLLQRFSVVSYILEQFMPQVLLVSGMKFYFVEECDRKTRQTMTKSTNNRGLHSLRYLTSKNEA